MISNLGVHIANATIRRRRNERSEWFYGNVLAMFIAGLVAMGWL